MIEDMDYSTASGSRFNNNNNSNNNNNNSSNDGGGRPMFRVPLSAPSNKFVTPRPTPRFFKTTDSPLSTKKEKVRSGGCGSPYPHRPPALSSSINYRTAPACISRVFPRRMTVQKPHFISFRTHSDTLFDKMKCKYYNESSADSYFDQCFDVERKLGEGSFGEVFQARCLEDGRRYAVKRSIEPFRNANDRQLRLSEVQKHELLPKHTNLVNFIRAWEERGRLYIQTELCAYSLSEYAQRDHEISEALLWNFLVDLLLAVKHLHDHDLLHLDIKPENIFITEDGVCKLGDFGLIFDLRVDDYSTAREGDSKYLAPELLEGRIEKAADIFSLGVTMLELACDLDLPTSGSAWQMLRHHQLPQDDLMCRLSSDLIRLIFWMMEPSPDRRPTADQLLRDPSVQSRYWRRSFFLAAHELSWSVQQRMLSFWLFLVSIFYWIVGLMGLSNNNQTNGRASRASTSKSNGTPIGGSHSPMCMNGSTGDYSSAKNGIATVVRTPRTCAPAPRLLFEQSEDSDEQVAEKVQEMVSIKDYHWPLTQCSQRCQQ